MRARDILQLTLGLVFCALTAPVASAQAPAETVIRQRLSDLGIAVTDVSITRDQVTVGYDQSETTSADVLMVTLSAIGQTVVEEAPDVAQVVVRATYLQQPFVALNISAADIWAARLGSIDSETLLQRIGVTELRPPGVAIQQNMALLGMFVSTISVAKGELGVTFVQPEAQSGDEVLLMWLQVFNWAAAKLPSRGVERVVLHVVLAGGPPVDVKMAMRDILAFQSGQLSPAEYLARLELGPAL